MRLLVGSGSWAGRGLALLLVVLIVVTVPCLPAGAQADDPGPPGEVVKLIFIHHSCGENWLSDGDGGLGRALAANNYFVSDTNYGWGPDGIGDRTDITDWPEWFTGPDSGRYLAALYAESGQLSAYERPLADPGGENRIVIFKSCFPNSNLEGSPQDPPARSGGLTVGNAKAIYNELLGYFASRPDKLFVAITAPPVQDPTYAANARAFNRWLASEWLAGYQGSNVAVFDFYNVLTDPDNHHRFRNGAVEYVTDGGGNTLYYPSDGDDHPASAGNRKATDEFVPLLNVYYHRWQGAGAAVPPATSPPAAPTVAPPAGPTVVAPTVAPQPSAPAAAASGLLDDFEGGQEDWAAFIDTEQDTHLACERDAALAHGGSASLRIEYDVAPESWASCSLVYPGPQDWRAAQGVRLYLHAEQAGQPLILIAYQGSSPDELLHFEYQLTPGQEALAGWQQVDLAWDQFRQPAWQGDSTVPFDPGRAIGFALLLPGSAAHSRGRVWLDDVSLLSSVAAQPAPPAPPAVVSQAEPPVEETGGRGGLCPGAASLSLGLLVGAVWLGRRNAPTRP